MTSRSASSAPSPSTSPSWCRPGGIADIEVTDILDRRPTPGGQRPQGRGRRHRHPARPRGRGDHGVRLRGRPGLGLRQDRQRRQQRHRRDHLRPHAPRLQPRGPGAGVGRAGPGRHQAPGRLGGSVRLQPEPAAVPASTPTPASCCGIRTESSLRPRTGGDGDVTPNYPDDPTPPRRSSTTRWPRPTCSAPSSWARSPARSTGRSSPTARRENRGGESTLGNLVAEVQRWATESPTTGSAQIAFMNPGGSAQDMVGIGSRVPAHADLQGRRPTCSRSPTRW